MNISSPLVTVAIPAYKSKYLYDTINSVIDQSYTNIEIIIVDDCSPHDVKTVVEQFSDSRIVYYVNQDNIGAENPALNWNKCLSLAHGEYFCLLCDDDIYKPSFIETMLNIAESAHDCNVFRARGCVIDKHGNEVDWYPTPPQYETTLDYMWHTFKGLRTQTISEFFYRTNHIRQCGGYVLLPLAWYADYLSVFLFSLSGGIVSSYEKLVGFRQSGDNISSQDDKNTIKKIVATNIYIDKVSQIIYGCPISDDLKENLVSILNQRTRINTKWNLLFASKNELFKIWKRRKELRIKAGWILHAILHHK